MVFVLGNHILWFDKLSQVLEPGGSDIGALCCENVAAFDVVWLWPPFFLWKKGNHFMLFMESNLYARMLGWNSWNLVLCWWPTYAYLSCIIRLFFPFFSIFHFISGRTLSMIYYSLSWPHWLGGIVQRAEILAPLMQKKKNPEYRQGCKAESCGLVIAGVQVYHLPNH